MKRSGALCLMVMAVAALAAAQGAPQKPEKANGQRGQVLVLGVYHMANPGHDIFNMKADDVLAPKRQAEMAQLLEVLKRFHPTKIAIESDAGDERIPKRYSDYLAGKYELSRNEIDQVGLRLAKDLGHTAVYPVDADSDFPWQHLVNYAKATGHSQELDAISNGWGDMVKEQGDYLGSHTVLETLLFMNSDERVKRDVGLYYRAAELGEPYDPAGADLLADWYRRNIRIYTNVAQLADAPGERVLVIFGAGHLGWLRQDIASNPNLQLRELSEFVTASDGVKP
jgi:hypothetical protein